MGHRDGTQDSRTDFPRRAGMFGPVVWQTPGHRSAGRALSRTSATTRARW